MIDLKNRSTKKELLDAANIPFADIKKNMQELETINRLLGGHKITLQGLSRFCSGGVQQISVCEIGCGGGDNLRAIYKFCTARKINVRLIGIDMKQECIDYARQRNADLPAQWICSDYQLTQFENDRPDVIFSSLFCHHFGNAALVEMLGWMQANSSKGFFINDLHRHPLAYYSIGFITRCFSRSYLVKHDAPLSVARGFLQKDWQALFANAGIQHYSLRWMWAFRHLIIFKK